MGYVVVCCFLFFFKQKTAYEMRISDWSSDVCSSDLKRLRDLTGVSPLLLGMLDAEDPEVVWYGSPAANAQPERPGLTVEQKREILQKVVTVRLYRELGRASCRERGCQEV